MSKHLSDALDYSLNSLTQREIESLLAREDLDKLEGPNYAAASRAELRREAREAARARQTAAASQNEAEESDESEDETAGERRTRVGRTPGGIMKVGCMQ